MHRVFCEEFGYAARPAALLTQLTTVNGRLPVGAPTSTGLLNLILRRAGTKIERVCDRLGGLNFTTWVDDFVLSGGLTTEAIDPVVQILMDEGYRIPRRKVKCQFAGKPQYVLGLAVNDGVQITDERLANVLLDLELAASGETISFERSDHFVAESRTSNRSSPVLIKASGGSSRRGLRPLSSPMIRMPGESGRSALVLPHRASTSGRGPP